jgi:hypothetical protein
MYILVLWHNVKTHFRYTTRLSSMIYSYCNRLWHLYVVYVLLLCKLFVLRQRGVNKQIDWLIDCQLNFGLIKVTIMLLKMNFWLHAHMYTGRNTIYIELYIVHSVICVYTCSGFNGKSIWILFFNEISNLYSVLQRA